MEANNTLIDNNETKSPSALNIAFKWALVSFLLYVIQLMVNMYMNNGEYNPRSSGWVQMLVGVVILFSLLPWPSKNTATRNLMALSVLDVHLKQDLYML